MPEIIYYYASKALKCNRFAVSSTYTKTTIPLSNYYHCDGGYCTDYEARFYELLLLGIDIKPTHLIPFPK